MTLYEAAFVGLAILTTIGLSLYIYKELTTDYFPNSH